LPPPCGGVAWLWVPSPDRAAVVTSSLKVR